MMAPANLPFIVSCGPKLQQDSDVRLLIRQKAMRNVALTRKTRRTKPRETSELLDLELAQDHADRRLVVPALITSSNADQSPEDTGPIVVGRTFRNGSVTRQGRLMQKKTPSKPMYKSGPACLSSVNLLSGYEAARAKFEVDVIDLSMLTNFSVGRSTVGAISSDPARLATLLGHSVWSYLQFVPSHYGPSHCLTTATDCLLAKYQGILKPHKRDEGLQIRLYTRALKSLQEALQDPLACIRSDVLCATQLIGLHELLDSNREEAWSYHIEGSARLIKHRTAGRFQNEFDKALFAAHIGPIVFEALMKDKHCYLEDKDWLQLYHSLIRQSDSLDDRSSLAIGIRSQMLTLPGLWHDIHKVVTSSDLFDDNAMSVVKTKCLTAHGKLLDWMTEYRTHCLATSLVSPTPQELNKRRELVGTCFECLIVVKRLLATVCDDNRLILEKEAQQMVRAILDLQKQSTGRHCWLFLGHESSIANTVMTTKEEWQVSFVYQSERERRLACRQRYVAWSGMLRVGH